MTKLSWFGVTLTILYLSALIWLVSSNWGAFASLEPNAWGDFLAGSLGPLAIFWLVLGFFKQGRELQNSVNALNLQAEELRSSVEQQKAMVRITEKQLDLDVQAHEKDTRLAAMRDLPFFQLTNASLDTVLTISRDRNGVFNLINHGAHANSVNISAPGSKYSPSPSYFANFPNGSAQQVNIPVSFGALNATRLIVESSNLRGQTRRQEFHIDWDGARMTSCFPEYEQEGG